MADPALIEGLNRALNREVSTFLRYMLQAASIKGAAWDAVRSMYLAEVPDEMGHAQYLTNTIVMLGGTPKLSPDLSPPPNDPRQMLQNDIEQEHVDTEGYVKLADLAEKHGIYDLKLKMEEQAAGEAGHAREMQRLMG